MDTIARYATLIDGPHALDEYTEEKFVHVDLSGRLDRRAYPLLLGTPPA
jgi:hypothetical protein